MIGRKKGPVFSRKAIVIGNDCYNTLGIVRSLGEKGVPVYLILITNRKGYVNKSKYVVQSWSIAVPTEELIPLLDEHFNEEEARPVVFPVTDDVVRIIDNNLDSLRTKYIMLNIKGIQGNVAGLMHKKAMNDVASEFGFITPRTWEIALNGQSVYLDGLVFPCIVKPVLSEEGRKTDMVICENQTSLEQDLLRLSASYSRVLIQEYIEDDKDLKKIGIIGCVTIGGEIVSPAVMVKVREYPLNTGTNDVCQGL